MIDEKIAIVGLGYVGLPLALAFASKYADTIGFDISERRVCELRSGHDRTHEVSSESLSASSARFTSDPEALRGCTFFIITVPTPIDENKQPDLSYVQSASETVGAVLSRGACVVYESTVYPGVTEEICRPILERVSGLKAGADFTVGYSPERINPGDKVHTLETIVKVVSGEDAETLERVATVYERIIAAGVYRAASIKVAEAAKVIENTQRDLNIALMNELALIFDRMGIRTKDVLDAAGTKWNFLKFTPGLVGGHCISVDPYYLTSKAESLGYHPSVILAGRRINDGMGGFIAQSAIKRLIQAGVTVKQARVGVLGVTFKENVPDIRNSRVPDIVRELREYGIAPILHDPLADPQEVAHEYALELSPWEALTDLDAVILAVAHAQYLSAPVETLARRMRRPGVVLDVKSALSPATLPSELIYWSL